MANKIERMKRDIKTVIRNENRRTFPLWFGVYNSDNRNKRNHSLRKIDTSLWEIGNGGGLILKTRKVSKEAASSQRIGGAKFGIEGFPNFSELVLTGDRTCPEACDTY